MRKTAVTLNSGIFGRGLTTNSVSSLVRLAVSSNFPSELLNKVCKEPLQLSTILRDQIECLFLTVDLMQVQYYPSLNQGRIFDKGNLIKVSRSLWESF